MLLGPEKAFTLFKSMMRTEVKIMLQLLFEVCCDAVTRVRTGIGDLVSAVQAWDFFTECSLTDITLYQNIAYHGLPKRPGPPQKVHPRWWVCLTPLAQTLGCLSIVYSTTMQSQVWWLHGWHESHVHVSAFP